MTDLSESKPYKKILLVDDEQDITTVIKKGLEQTGKYIVDTFNHPRDALANFKAGVYDLLIIDIKMPAMTGFQLYKELIKIDPRPKICFITAFEMYYDEFKKLFPSLDIKCFIRKPVTMSDLTREVDAEFQSTAPRVRPR
jgi:two-component system, OmpR family, response regulator ChvI